MASFFGTVLLALTTLVSGVVGTFNSIFTDAGPSQVAQVISANPSILMNIPKVPRINYHGFNFVEDSNYNLHYLSELAGVNNTVIIADYGIYNQNPQTLADNIRKNKYIALEFHLNMDEATFTNTGGARDQYLARVKKYLYQDSDLWKMLTAIHLLEEEFTLLRGGFFSNWSIFQDPNLVANCQAKYGDRTLNYTNCTELMMKEGLESFIDDIHKTFPGIPVVIVENHWGFIWNPPANLDILGIDAYYIPTSTACDTTQRARFDDQVTTILKTAKKFGKPIQIVAPVFDDTYYKMLSECQVQWYIDLAKATPEVTSFHWFLYADVEKVKGIRNYVGSPLTYLKNEGAKIVAEAAKPVVTSAVISSKNVVANGATTYDISVTSMDVEGVDDIKVQYALVNQLYQGVNGGQYRGYVGWGKDGDATQRYFFPGISGSSISCSGGGTASKAVGYGEEYINLLSCSTSTNGNYRTTKFTVAFNNNFVSPTKDNVVSGWSADGALNRSTWVTTDTGFSLKANSAPKITSTTINPKPVTPYVATQYNISVTTTDDDGESDIKVQYALINQLNQGPNGGQYRGYIGWSRDGDSVQKYFFPGISGSEILCAGGGKASKAVGYGEEYINLVSCSTSASGNSRTTNFTVTFNTNFTLPLTDNSISGWSADNMITRSTWITYEKFSILNAKPTIVSANMSSPTITADGQTNYTITVTTSDPNGESDVKVQYALVNQLNQGTNGGQYRGYIGWSKDGDSVQKYFFPGISGVEKDCSGGGKYAKAVGYGEEYVNLLGCSTSVVNGNRVTVFTVSYNPNFTTPATGNVVSGWSGDSALNRSTWVTTQAPFSVK